MIYIPMLFFTFMRFNPETNIYLFLSQYLIMFLLCLLIAIVYTDLDKVSMLATIFSLSIFISYCAMWIGKLNEYFINPNVAFIIAGTNFIFDTLTIFTTYGILKYLYYIEKKGFIFYFSFVFLDILVASFLSIFVLIVINLFLDLGYTFSNIINVFLGYSVVDSNRDLGGWFWLMHTTFLPTFFYLSLYLLTLFGKAIIIPIGKKIGKASVVDRPHYYTATMFGFIGLVVLAIARVTKWITEMSTY